MFLRGMLVCLMWGLGAYASLEAAPPSLLGADPHSVLPISTAFLGKVEQEKIANAEKPCQAFARGGERGGKRVTVVANVVEAKDKLMVANVVEAKEVLFSGSGDDERAEESKLSVSAEKMRSDSGYAQKTQDSSNPDGQFGHVDPAKDEDTIAGTALIAVAILGGVVSVSALIAVSVRCWFLNSNSCWTFCGLLCRYRGRFP